MSDQLTELRLRKTEGLCGTVERRTLSVPQIELRDAGDGSPIVVSGYAATTETPYDVGSPERGGFMETIARGAFKRTLNESPDVLLNALHGRGLSGLPLARTKSGTLRLVEDERGLFFSADLDPTDPDVRLLLPKMRRGDLDGASFAFRVTAEDWSKDRSQRRITAVTLHQGDVSIVDFGANPTAVSQIAQRSARAETSRARPSAAQVARERLILLERRDRAARSVAAVPTRSRFSTDALRARVAELRGELRP